MNKHILIFLGLSLLVVVAGLPLTLQQNWAQFSSAHSFHFPVLESDTVHHLYVLCEQDEELSIQTVIGEAPRVLLVFPPNICGCLDADFAQAINSIPQRVGEENLLVIVPVVDDRETASFRMHMRLSAPVYRTNDPVLVEFDPGGAPFAAVIFPDMTARHIMTIHPHNINELITYASEVFSKNTRLPVSGDSLHSGVLYGGYLRFPTSVGRPMDGDEPLHRIGFLVAQHPCHIYRVFSRAVRTTQPVGLYGNIFGIWLQSRRVSLVSAAVAYS